MFNDSNLERVFLETKEKMEDKIQSLDRISSDIKSLEKLMKENVISIATFFVDDFDHLSWDGTRILLKNMDYAKPFIECKADVRLKYAKFLPDLLKKCMEATE